MSTPELIPTHVRGKHYARVDLYPLPESTLSSDRDLGFGLSLQPKGRFSPSLWRYQRKLLKSGETFDEA